MDQAQEAVLYRDGGANIDGVEYLADHSAAGLRLYNQHHGSITVLHTSGSTVLVPIHEVFGHENDCRIEMSGSG